MYAADCICSNAGIISDMCLMYAWKYVHPILESWESYPDDKVEWSLLFKSERDARCDYGCS